MEGKGDRSIFTRFLREIRQKGNGAKFKMFVSILKKATIENIPRNKNFFENVEIKFTFNLDEIITDHPPSKIP